MFVLSCATDAAFLMQLHLDFGLGSQKQLSNLSALPGYSDLVKTVLLGICTDCFHSLKEILTEGSESEAHRKRPERARD